MIFKRSSAEISVPWCFRTVVGLSAWFRIPNV